MRVLTVVGARPQFVKAAVVSRALRELGATEEILHTGQHFDAAMSDQFFEELAIPTPTYNLGLGGLTHGAMTGQMLEGIEQVLLAKRPDWVLVYGDTNSTLAGALAAVKLHIPVAHVEAGLRSFNRRMPEEINRVLTDHASDFLFAPTLTATDNLAKEGISGDKVRQVGDVMFDAAQFYGAGEVAKGDYVLATVHRAENTDDAARLAAILGGLREVARTMRVVLPLHPRTARLVSAADLEGIDIVEPVGYLEMVKLERGAAVIATDSGGVQKEAYFYGVPCVTLRNETEWVELVESGWNRLCPPESPEWVARAILDAVGTTGKAGSLYGTGNAGSLIAEALVKAR